MSDDTQEKLAKVITALDKITEWMRDLAGFIPQRTEEYERIYGPIKFTMKIVENLKEEKLKTVEEQIKEAVEEERKRCESIAQYCRSRSESDMRTVIYWINSGDWPEDDEEDG